MIRIIKSIFNKQLTTNGTLPIARNFYINSNLCAGHSKWANIRHIKALKDGQKAASFTKLSRQIRLAIQEGGSIDPNLNSSLRMAIDEAIRKNMPMATIQNNIKKSQQSKVSLSKYIVQIRCKQKIFAVCICYTDNFAQLKMEMATLLRKAGAQYVDVVHMFDEFGLITANYKSAIVNADQFEERVAEDAILSEAEDFYVTNSAINEANFICRPTHLQAISKAIEEKGYDIMSMEHVFSAKNIVQLSPDEQKDYDIFLQKLRSLNGVEDIYDNAEEH